jgi:hypothetical protein
MPKLLRDTSRVFRHHTAISRQRIAAFDNPLYGVTDQDRVQLLERAIEDVKKLGLTLHSEKTDCERVYRVIGRPDEDAEASTSAQPQAA